MWKSVLQNFMILKFMGKRPCRTLRKRASSPRDHPESISERRALLEFYDHGFASVNLDVGLTLSIHIYY